jgi:SET domain-containing protein
MAKLPHIGAFVRLKPSRLHGIGVFAIRDIPKGTYVFRGDNEDMLWVKVSATGRLDEEVKKLYRDFCVLRDGKYGCPRSFNLLTPAWYINHSEKPNLAADETFDFYSTRRIQKGEELTLSYKRHSDAQARNAF